VGQGTLSYDDFGNLRMEIRADEASADLLRAAGIDIRDNVISTDGHALAAALAACSPTGSDAHVVMAPLSRDQLFPRFRPARWISSLPR
jgi:hypothetical protein